MKKITAIALLAFIVFACSRKTAPTTTQTTPQAPTTETVKTEAPVETTPVPPVSDTHAEMLAAGKTIYTGKCARCHGAKEVSAYTPERWNGILKSMVPKARLNEEETKQVTAYVMANAKK